VASMNACSHCNRPRASSWPRNARHSRSQIPSASQSRRRRQQVLPLGIRPGDRATERRCAAPRGSLPRLRAARHAADRRSVPADCVGGAAQSSPTARR
jgi:hypothetical protein